MMIVFHVVNCLSSPLLIIISLVVDRNCDHSIRSSSEWYLRSCDTVLSVFSLFLREIVVTSLFSLKREEEMLLKSHLRTISPLVTKELKREQDKKRRSDVSCHSFDVRIQKIRRRGEFSLFSALLVMNSFLNHYSWCDLIFCDAHDSFLNE